MQQNLHLMQGIPSAACLTSTRLQAKHFQAQHLQNLREQAEQKKQTGSCKAEGEREEKEQQEEDDEVCNRVHIVNAFSSNSLWDSDEEAEDSDDEAEDSESSKEEEGSDLEAEDSDEAAKERLSKVPEGDQVMGGTGGFAHFTVCSPSIHRPTHPAPTRYSAQVVWHAAESSHWAACHPA